MQIKVYAVSKYNDGGLEFSSRCYFEAPVNSEEEGNYNYALIRNIIYVTSFLPVGLMTLVASLAPMFFSYLEEHFQEYLNSHFNNEYFIASLKKIVLIISIFLNMAFVTFHILAIIRLFEYSYEINEENNVGAAVIPPLLHTLLSLLALLLSALLTIYKIRSWKIDIALIMNLVYLAYFFPYMLLAFIDNPMQALFVYILQVIAVAFFLLLFVSLSSIRYILKSKERSKYSILYVAFFSSFYLVYLFICIILLLTLGGFNNFEELRTLFWPITGVIILAVVGYYFKKVREKFQPNSN